MMKKKSPASMTTTLHCNRIEPEGDEKTLQTVIIPCTMRLKATVAQMMSILAFSIRKLTPRTLVCRFRRAGSCPTAKASS